MAYIELSSLNKLQKQLGIEPDGVVQTFFTHTCRLHCDKYVPYESGPLSNNVSETPSSFTYESPYAEYQYRGERKDGSHKIVNRTYDKHPLATSYWDKHMVTAEGNEVASEVRQFMRRKI